MARIYANINKETLSYICSQTGVTVSFLSQRTGFTEERLGSWIDMASGDYPTINQAKSIARVLKIPFAGLYMDKGLLPLKRLPSLRNLRTLPNGLVFDDSSINLAVAELIRFHDFLITFEAEMNVEPQIVSLPSISMMATAKEYASEIRRFFAIDLADQFKLSSSRQFYLYVRKKIESKGIFIHCFTDVDVDIARGISIYDVASPIIGINEYDRYPAKTFSIIHELTHILKRQSTLCNEMASSFSTTAEEVFCNAVAGEVLVPADSLSAHLSANSVNTISLVEVSTIAKRFNISKEVIIRRLLETKRFTHDEYDTFANEIRENFLKEHEREKIARQEGRGQAIPKIMSREAIDKTSPAICRILLAGYSDGFFSKQDVSGYLGIKERHIPAFFEEVAKW